MGISGNTRRLECGSSGSNGAVRRHWSAAELQALERWAGVHPVHVICRRLGRSERSVRCKLHRRGLSACVCEGVGLQQVCEDLGLPVQAVKACILSGHLRLHSARVHGTAPPQPRWSLRRWLQAAQKRVCRISHLRITEASLRRFARAIDMDTGRAAAVVRMGAALRHWATG